MSEDTHEEVYAPTTRYATLIRGRYYDYDGLIWNRDENQLVHEVTASQEAYLTDNAYDAITVDGEEHRRPKFEFTDENPEDEEAAPAPKATTSRRRQRTRVAAD